MRKNKVQKISTPAKNFLEKFNYCCLWNAAKWISETLQSLDKICKKHLRCCISENRLRMGGIIKNVIKKGKIYLIVFPIAITTDPACAVLAQWFPEEIFLHTTITPFCFVFLIKAYFPGKYCFNIKKCGRQAYSSQSIPFRLLLQNSQK